MLNNKQIFVGNGDESNDDSWEVRAFEEDTRANLLGCTWPPRSYTCTFCRREFRSAQALGGHMNVHRRDRARLHDASPLPVLPPPPTAAIEAPPAGIFITTGGREFVGNGLCLLYPLHNPNNNTILIPTPSPMDFRSPNILPIISPFSVDRPNDNTADNSVVSSLCHSSNTEPSPSNSNDNDNNHGEKVKDNSAIEELDLELRLGRRPPPPL